MLSNLVNFNLNTTQLNSRSRLFLVTDILSNQKYALKVALSNKPESSKAFGNELEAHIRMNSSNPNYGDYVSKLYQTGVFRSNPNLLEEEEYMLFKQYDLDLFNFIQQILKVDSYIKPNTRENIIRYLFKQIIEIVWNLNLMGVVHRDISMENLLVDLKQKKIRLCGFGSCDFLDKNGNAKFSRSLSKKNNFSAPEFYFLKEDEVYSGIQSEVYSLGHLLFKLIFIENPFNFPNEKDLKYKEFNQGKLFARLEKTKAFSTELLCLIKKMLDPTPSMRPNLQQLVDDAWFKLPNPSEQELNAVFV